MPVRNRFRRAAMLIAAANFLAPCTALAQSAAEPPAQPPAQPPVPPPAQPTDAPAPAHAEPAPTDPAIGPAEPGVNEPFLTFNPNYYDFSPGDNPTDPVAEIDEAFARRKGMITVPGLTPAIDFIRKPLDDLFEATGLRIAIAYTLLFQQASAGPGDRTAAAGDLDFMSDWTILGRGTLNTGRLIVTGEYRHKIGDITPNALGPEIGTLQRTTGGFNDRGWAVRDLHWVQSLFDGRFRVLVGRADVSDYVGGHRLQSINNSFSNRNFSSDSTTAYPAGHVFTLGGSVRPVDWFYVTGGAANAYGTSTTSDLQSLDQHEYFTFGEVGFTPSIKGLGWGRYAVLIWNMDQRDLLNLPSDNGYTFIIEQDFSDRFQIFARYGWANDGALTGIKSSGQFGMGYRGLLGNPLNLTGAAVGISEPANSTLRDETVVEVFHRFQLTDNSQFSVGIQGIFDPSNAPEDDALAVLTLRFRIAF